MALALPKFLALLKYLRKLLRELGSETPSEKVSPERGKAWDRERGERERESESYRQLQTFQPRPSKEGEAGCSSCVGPDTQNTPTQVRPAVPFL